MAQAAAAAASLAAVMPLLAPGVNYFRGMGRDNLAEFGLAMAGRQHIDPWAQHAAARLRLATAAEHAEAFRTLLSDTDFATISGPPRPVAGGHDP